MQQSNYYFVLFSLLLNLIVSSAIADEKKAPDNWGIIYGISNTLVDETTVDFDIKLRGNKFYFNNQSFLIKRNTMPAEDFFKSNNIEKTYFSLKERQALLEYNYNIKLKDNITYLQFDKNIDNSLLKQYVTQNRQALLLDDMLLLFGKDGEPVFYSKPYFEKEFIQQVPPLATINVPFNQVDAFVLYQDHVLKPLSIHFKNFLDLPWFATDISGAKYPSISPIINPIFIDVGWDSGYSESYLYLFSNDYKVLDKLVLFNYLTSTRGGPGGSGYPVGYRYFTIDKNYFIERRQRFEDETIEVQQFQVTKEGKFQELPVTSNCYSKLAVKDNKTHSTKSLLLTSQQANNYMRFESARIDELYGITLTLNPADKKLCVNYQQAHSFTFGKAKSKQLFGNEKLYQQQVENFKKFSIDISNELEYIIFNNIDKSPLAKYLLNGNKAIYMNEMLFIVGENYLAAYRQPTETELTYQE
ncbi:hypothetical protein [Gilliamella sp. G0441]|uniref:hypothetical protein n=2 Tax=Gilliamella TaxID=1193503 RepID=UPI003D351202